jgi:hypothetical protein
VVTAFLGRGKAPLVEVVVTLITLIQVFPVRMVVLEAVVEVVVVRRMQQEAPEQQVWAAVEVAVAMALPAVGVLEAVGE